ncbi:hypothetical protein [Staphylococcus epidermidis]|nr:hypothetical protein [Staphylococcus epidermidis]
MGIGLLLVVGSMVYSDMKGGGEGSGDKWDGVGGSLEWCRG